MINIFLILWKQTDKVCILSDRLPRQFEIILSEVEAVDIAMPSSDVVGDCRSRIYSARLAADRQRSLGSSSHDSNL